MTASLWRMAIFAFLAMCAADLTGTAMVVAEAHFDAIQACLLDEAQWVAGIVCTIFGVGDLIRERRITKKVAVAFVAISAGNLVGTFVGVAVLGHLIAPH